jgi:hypothetical protein
MLHCPIGGTSVSAESKVDLEVAELTAVQEALATLVSNLEETVKGLPEAERHSYEEAEQSVVDARRKAETHEGLLQVN